MYYFPLVILFSQLIEFSLVERIVRWTNSRSVMIPAIEGKWSDKERKSLPLEVRTYCLMTVSFGH